MAGPTLFRPDSISSGLVGYWKFNNDATDSSGNSYDLTGINTPAYAAEDYWKTGEYSTDLVAASSQYYTRTRNADLDLLNAFTIAFWMKADDITAVTIVDKDGGGDGYRVTLDASSKVVLTMANGARATSATAVSAGKWQHIVCRYTQTTADVFIDGNLDISSAYSTDCADEATDLTIAAIAGGSNFWDGHLKDLAFWSSALTPIQIKSLAMGVDLTNEAYRPGDVSTTPDVWWKLNGNGNDSIGSETLTETGGITYEGGYIEGAAPHLDGSADYFAGTDSTIYDFSGGVFSIAAWIKCDTVTGTDTIWEQSTDANNRCEFQLEAGKLNFSVTSAGTEVVNVVGATTIALRNQSDGENAWHHVAIVEDGDTWTLYMDGVDDTDSGGTDTDRCQNYTGDIRIGTDQAGANDFDGFICDVAIWKGYAVTAAEMAKLASGWPLQQSGLEGYWKMDEASGNRTDSSGNGYTLTDVNTVTSDSAGVVGTCATFDASNAEHLLITHAALSGMDWQKDFSVVCWARQHNTTGSKAIVYKENTNTAVGGFGMYFDGSANLLSYTDGLDVIADNGTLTANIWWFTCCGLDGAYSWAGSNGRINDRKANAHMAAVSTDPFSVGSGGTLGVLDGDIDELTLWNRTLHPEELCNLYCKGMAGLETTSEPNPPTPPPSGATRRVFMIT